MKEIWVLNGPYWKIPCWVTHTGADVIVKVGAGIKLMDLQRIAAERLLEPMSIRKGLRFRTELSALKMVATEAHLPEPEMLLVWNPPMQVFEEEGKLRFPNEDANEFCRTFFETNACSQLRSISEAVYLFHAFCRHLFHYMINEQKSVDLLFCKLHPHPFRGNWKHVLYDADTKKVEANRVSRPLDRLADKFLRPQMFAYNRRHHVIEWQFEVEPSPLWRKSMLALENKRKEKFPGDLYWREILDFAKRTASGTQALYEDFYRQIYDPYPGFPEKWAAQCGTVVPRQASDRKHARVPLKDHRPSPLPTTLDTEQNPQGKPDLVGPPPPGLRKMRYLRPDKKKVRRRKKRVGKSHHKQRTDHGMPVCDAPGSPEPG